MPRRNRQASQKVGSTRDSVKTLAPICQGCGAVWGGMVRPASLATRVLRGEGWVVHAPQTPAHESAAGRVRRGHQGKQHDEDRNVYTCPACVAKRAQPVRMSGYQYHCVCGAWFLTSEALWIHVHQSTGRHGMKLVLDQLRRI